MSAIDLASLTAASTPAAVAREIERQAADLAGFLDVAELPEGLDREAYRVLADCRDRLARLAARIEAVGPNEPAENSDRPALGGG
jgi:hypothetical protein